MAAHNIRWWVYAGSERIRHTTRMRGQWGYDATCSCGHFDTKTGGATRAYIEQEIWLHKFGTTSSASSPRTTEEPS